MKTQAAGIQVSTLSSKKQVFTPTTLAVAAHRSTFGPSRYRRRHGSCSRRSSLRHHRPLRPRTSHLVEHRRSLHPRGSRVCTTHHVRITHRPRPRWILDTGGLILHHSRTPRPTRVQHLAHLVPCAHIQLLSDVSALPGVYQVRRLELEPS